MYYLLEDNRIVNSLSIREDLDLLVGIDFYVEKDEIVLTIGHIYIERISIIKKAENVYDLIENGDLLKYKDRFDGIVCLDIVKEVDVKLKTIQLTTNLIKYHEVISFYKPDANGNYIKAWEKKDDINK